MLFRSVVGNINRSHYPALNQILWDMHQKFISPQLAFATYEKRWAYIDEQKLLDKEKQLIERLTKNIGNGFFMPAI